MSLNSVKLGRAVTFMIYLASVYFTISAGNFWKKVAIQASNLLYLAELVIN